MKLEQYFEAYDNTHTLAGKSPDWGHMRRKIQWTIARPILELTGQVVFLLACVALGFWGHPIGYLLAISALCFIPQYVGNLRAQVAGIRGLADEEGLEQLLVKEAQRRMAGAVLATGWYGVVTLLFLGTSAVAAWQGKDLRPGLFAGLIVGAFAAHALFIRLPGAGREMAMLDRRTKKSNGRKERRDGN
jgi:hypothetical protein